MNKQTHYPAVNTPRDAFTIVDDFIHNWLSDERWATPAMDKDFVPTIDLKENSERYQVNVEIPGMRKEDITVGFTDNVLTIQGEKKREFESDKGKTHYSECSYGSFLRTLPFTDKIDSDKVDAKYNNGVLTITLPKSPEAKQHKRHIAIH